MAMVLVLVKVMVMVMVIREKSMTLPHYSTLLIDFCSQYFRVACAKNEASTKELSEDPSQPLNYYAAFAKVHVLRE